MDMPSNPSRITARMADEPSSYRALIEGLCQLVGLGPEVVDTVASGGLVTIDGINFSILLNSVHAGAQAISIYVDMGAPPAAQEAAVLRMLMQRNFHESAQRSTVYCVSSITGHVLSVSHFSVTGLTSQTLHEVVQRLIDDAIEWDSTYFLWAPKPSERMSGVGSTSAASPSTFPQTPL